MFRIIRMTVFAVMAFFALGRAATAQEPAPPTFEGEVNVNEVLLDVLVTDAKGNVIVGLDKGDFVVKENGKPVDLAGVTFYSNRRLLESKPTLAKQGVSVEQVPEDRYFIILFEDMKHTAQEAPQLLTQQMEAAKRARGWVDGELLPNDWVAVASYDTRLKVQQDFTRDRQALIEAIGAAQKGKDRETNYPSRVDTSKGPSLLAGLPKGTELRDRTSNIYEAMQQIARSAGNIRGRKNLLLFTYGLPGRVEPFGNFVPDDRYFKPTIRALNDNNVAAYTLDLTPPATEHILSDALNHLSDETGGRYFFNVTNFSTPLDQVSKENSGYYLLSYQSDQPAGKSGFQEVEVKTTNPEFRVRARKGYDYGRDLGK